MYQSGPIGLLPHVPRRLRMKSCGSITSQIGFEAALPVLRTPNSMRTTATYPFVADVAAIAGKVLRNEGAIDSGSVRARLKASWGGRDAVAVGSRKGIQTLRLF